MCIRDRVRDWTIIMAKEKMAWVNPLGRPSRMSCLRNAALGRRWEGFTWRTSRICSSRIRHSPPETTWEIMVAMATPATSQWKPATNHTSSTMFSRQAMMRQITGMTESPRPVSYTHLDVYKRQVHSQPLLAKEW